MRAKYNFCLSVMCLLLAFLVAMSGLRKRKADAALAARIAPEILRFHVLANSDSPEDQALKLEVKDLLLEEIQNGVQGNLSDKGNVEQTDSDDNRTEDETNEAAETEAMPESREAVCRYILEHRESLKRTAEEYMKSRGFDYPAEIRLEQCDFPEKTYGDMTFPAGTYDAVRVLLGEGKGQNFWCVLYPSLCYLDSTHAVVPDESKEALRALLPEDDFQALILSGNPGRQPLKIRLKFAELFRS